MLAALGGISVLGILIVQIFWLRKAFDLRSSQFNYNVEMALKNVVESLCQYNGSDIPQVNPIEQVSSNYFVVRTNDVIPAGSLEYFLKGELQKRALNTNFEYTIYDCSNQKIVYDQYVTMDRLRKEKPHYPEPPGFEENEYYFSVFFPHKTASIVNQMGIWVFSSSVLVVVILFFISALFIIFRQKRLSEVQRDFVNNMAHEFKTPIATIAIASEFLRKPEAANNRDKLFSYASIIQNESVRLQNEVERVLQIAKPGKSQPSLKLEALNLHRILKDVKNQIQLAHADKNIKFNDVKVEQPIAVLGDKMHLHNVIYNLIDNGIKYNRRSPEISLAINCTDKTVHLAIADNGIGIPKTARRRIYDRFFRVSTGDVHDTKGFGIGLFYVRMILRRMNGSILLSQSGPGGSKFIIKIPKA